MGNSTLILGGARSGKSSYAEKCAETGGGQLVYIATATAGDREMADRIEAHQKRRGPEWRTVEEPLALARAIGRADEPGNTILVDCLTLWLTNLLFMEKLDDRQVTARFEQLAELLPGLNAEIFLVSNETGLGLVPPDPLSRRFRDLAGFMNQTVARAASRVVFTAAGLPLPLKGDLPL